MPLFFISSSLYLERLCGDVWTRRIVSLRGCSIRWTLQFGVVSIATRLGVSLREVSKTFASSYVFACGLFMFSLLHHHTFRWMRDWSGKVFFIMFLFRKINFHRFFSFSHYFIWNLIRSLIGSLCCVIMCIWWLFFTWPRRNISLEDHRTHITHTIGVGNEE